MIALCGMHHDKADGGAWTKTQLRALKRATNGDVRGRFEWMREDILAVVGGNLYYETPIILQVNETPKIWFNRDEEGRLLLNLNLLSTSQEPRLVLEDNDWLLRGTPVDFESPPSGKRIHAEYSNGDRLDLTFREMQSLKALSKKYPSLVDPTEPWDAYGLKFPLAVVEVNMAIGGTSWALTATGSTVGNAQISRCFASRSRVGLSITT